MSAESNGPPPSPGGSHAALAAELARVRDLVVSIRLTTIDVGMELGELAEDLVGIDRRRMGAVRMKVVGLIQLTAEVLQP